MFPCADINVVVEITNFVVDNSVVDAVHAVVACFTVECDAIVVFNSLTVLSDTIAVDADDVTVSNVDSVPDGVITVVFDGVVVGVMIEVILGVTSAVVGGVIDVVLVNFVVGDIVVVAPLSTCRRVAIINQY